MLRLTVSDFRIDGFMVRVNLGLSMKSEIPL